MILLPIATLICWHARHAYSCQPFLYVKPKPSLQSALSQLQPNILPPAPVPVPLPEPLPVPEPVPLPEEPVPLPVPEPVPLPEEPVPLPVSVPLPEPGSAPGGGAPGGGPLSL